MKKYYPKIKFITDKKIDKKILSNFDKFWLEWALRPELRFLISEKFTIKEKKKIVYAYIDNFYLIHSKKIKIGLKEQERRWQKLEKKYYQKVDTLFKDYPWPRGTYRAYVSIWYCFPRFIEEKYFTFPYETKKYFNDARFAIRVIAHEMLHFITYDYLQKVYKLKPSESYHKDNKFWQFTENLNTLIENENTWKDFFIGNQKPYDNCKKLYVQMKKIWDKNKDLDNLIEKIFKVKKHDK